MFTIVIGIWPHLSLSRAWYSEASNLGPSNTRYSTPIMSCILLLACKHPPGICCTVLSTTIPFLESQPHPKRFEIWIPNGQGLVPHAAPLGAASASLAPDFRANAPMKLVKSGMKSRGLPTVLRWKLHHTVPPAHFHSPVSCLDDHPSNGYNPLLHGKISSRYKSFYCPLLRQEATTRTLGWHENQKWHFKIGLVILVVAGPIGVLPGCRCSLHRHCDDPPVMPTFLWDHMTGFIWRIFFQIVSFSWLGIANHDSKIWTNTQNRSHRIEYIQYIYI